MSPLWRTQILAVTRLELKKTFFSKRGLWVYLLALLPVALFVAHAVVVNHGQRSRSRLASGNERSLSYRDLAAIHSGMTRSEVLETLGKPPSAHFWQGKKSSLSEGQKTVQYENYRYSDGAEDLYVQLADGKVTGTGLEKGETLAEDSIVFAGVFQFFYLRLAIFFGCLGIFMNLFRGELLDKTLHFYFLAPIRRETLLVGKYLAGLVAAAVIFTTSEALQIIAFAWGLDQSALNAYLYAGHGMQQAAAYLGITLLACIGYGSVFLAAGVWFRNPVLPAAALLIWEALNPFLPTFFEKFSVIYYLKSLCPLEVPLAPGTPALFTLLISNPEPVAAPIAIFGIVLVAALVLFIASLAVRRLEINYATE